MGVFSEIFCWWCGNTWSNRIYTAFRGKLIGTDDMGNRYYERSRGIGPLGVPRRWVIYKDLAEASLIPPGWHGWMHYTADTSPTAADNNNRKPWEAPHRPNMTGTALAYHPKGSVLNESAGDKPTGDYQPWRPDHG